MRMFRLVVVVLGCVAGAVPALAQEPAGSVAFGFGLSTSLDGVDDCPPPIDSCNPITRSFSGEGAFNVSDRLAVVGRLRLGFASLGASEDGVSLKLANLRSTSLSGGVRVYGVPGSVRAFGEVLGGYVTQTAVIALGETAPSISVSGLGIAPAAGVDVAIGDRAAIRISGGVSIARGAGDTATSIGGGVGLVFGVGSR